MCCLLCYNNITIKILTENVIHYTTVLDRSCIVRTQIDINKLTHY